MTTPTSNPVPSQAPQDMIFNVEALDVLINGSALTTGKRLGGTAITWAGLTAQFNEQSTELMDGLNAEAAITATGINRAGAEAAEDGAQAANAGAQSALAGAVAAAEMVGDFRLLADAVAGMASQPDNKACTVSADSLANRGYYVNRAGVLVKEGDDTLMAVSARIQKTNRRGWLWLVRDANGRLMVGINRAGRLVLGVGGDIFTAVNTNATTIASILATVRSRTSRAGAILFRLPNGRMPGMFTRNGRFLLGSLDVKAVLTALMATVAGSSTAIAGNTADIAAVRGLVVPGKNILVVGDSLSADSFSWARTMSTVLTDTARVTLSLAVGGQTASQQAGRLGAIPFLITAQNNTILASGPTVVTASQMLMYDGALDTIHSITVGSTTWKARLAGILGTFSSTAGFDSNGQPNATVFTPDAGQITVDTLINPRTPTEAVVPVGHEYDLLLVGIGRNDWGTDNVPRRIEIVKRAILAIRDHFQLTAQRRMLVVTPPNRYKNPSTGTVYDEGSGSATFTFFTSLETWAQQTFGEMAVLSRLELMRHADLGNADDVAAVAAGCVPPSLTSDGLHWTATGHTYVRAPGAAVLNRKGW